MESAAFLPLTHHVAHLDDPHVERTKLHRLLDIVLIALFGQTEADWLRQFLALPNGIPSHDTFNRVFAALNLLRLSAITALRGPRRLKAAWDTGYLLHILAATQMRWPWGLRALDSVVALHVK